MSETAGDTLTRERTVFRVNPISYVTVAVISVAILVPISMYPLALSWLVLLPAAFAWWVARTRTVVDERGLTLTSWRSRTTVPWSKVKGVNFPKSSFGQVVTTDDEYYTMGGVGFSNLPELSVASRGRIPDPYALEAEARADATSSADDSADDRAEGDSAEKPAEEA